MLSISETKSNGGLHWGRALFFLRPLGGVLLLPLFLIGCANGLISGDDQPKPTKIEINITTGKDLNVHGGDVSTPVRVLILTLSSISEIEGKGYFPVVFETQNTLGKTLQHQEEIILSPEENTSLEFSVDALSESKYLAVLAQYKDWENAKWKVLHSLKSGKRNRFDLSLRDNDIDIRRK